MRRFVLRALLATVVAVSATGCAAGGAGVDPTGDIGGRYLVLIPAFEGPSGDRVADELRALVTQHERYAAIGDQFVQAAMEQYDVEALTMITARQLAPLMRAQLVSWGTVSQGGPGLQAEVKFIDARSADEIDVDASGATPQELAASIYQGFSQAMEGVAQASYCNDYLSSSQFDRALETCDAALEIVPNNTAALYGRATALLNLERHEEALEAYERLLAIDPTHQDALLGAGLVASRLDRGQQAMGFYNRYLEVNPGNVQVRMTVAGDIVSAGDYVSAFRVLEPAIAENRENTEFQTYLFSVATAAGQRAREQATSAADSAAANQIFTAAYDAYQLAYSNGTEADPAALRNVIAVTSALGRSEDALRIAAQATERHPDDAQIWFTYAAALRDAGQEGEALRALSRVVEIDPDFPDIYIRRGQAYLQAGQRQQALADLERAAQAGDRDRVAQVLYATGATGIRSENWADAVSILSVAHGYASGNLRSDISFFWGYALYKQGETIARANTQGNPQQAQRALDFFQRALPLVQSSNHAQASQVVSGAQQYIQNQEAIIQSSRR